MEPNLSLWQRTASPWQQTKKQFQPQLKRDASLADSSSNPSPNPISQMRAAKTTDSNLDFSVAKFQHFRNRICGKPSKGRRIDNNRSFAQGVHFKSAVALLSSSAYPRRFAAGHQSVALRTKLR
jgi:hypothetical protein